MVPKSIVMKSNPKYQVIQLPEKDIEQVVDVFCDAFSEYPVMKYVLGDTTDYDSKYRKLIHFFVLNRVLKKEFMFGIIDEDHLKAVATVSIPFKPVQAPELESVRQQIWQELGNKARVRYEQFGTVCSQFDIDEPHIHLNMLGVKKEAQGLGLGRILLEYVHDFSKKVNESQGVTLSTEMAKNVPFYEYFGYKLLGKAPVDSVFTTWNFYRPNS